MTTIGMHYDVLAGKEADFVAGFDGVMSLLKTLPGHVESRLFQDVHSPGSYVIFSQWETKEAFAKFIQSDEFKSATNWGRAEILRGRPTHKIYLNQ